MPMPLPPDDRPPAWFMPHWLDGRSWFWDAGRRRHVLVLRNHVVQIVARRGVDWTWRVERMTGFGAGVVSVSGFDPAASDHCRARAVGGRGRGRGSGHIEEDGSMTATMTTNEDTQTAIRAAFQAYDGRSAFLWRYADPVLDDLAVLPDDPAPAALAEHYREATSFAVGFADRFEGARRTLVEAVKAAIADAAPSDERRWQNFCVSFGCFDHDMAA
jgi:hypothetical protein